MGIISISSAGVAHHARQVRALGLPASSLADSQQRDTRLIEVGSRLRDAHGADVIILGCAGLSDVRKPLQAALGLRVIDPVQAAVAQALGALLPDQ